MIPSVAARFFDLASNEPDRACLHVQAGLLDGSAPCYRTSSRVVLARRVRAAAARLRSAGVGRGDRVLWSLPNGPAWIALDLACPLLGAVSVIVHPATSPKALSRIVAETSPRVAVLAQEVPAVARGPRLLLPEELEAADGGDVDATGDPGELASVMYTSGSTGEPKGAMLTHAGLLSNAVATAEALALRADDVLPGVLSFSHSAGRTALLHAAIVAGASIALPDRIDVDSDPAAVAAARPSVLVSVPRVLERLAGTAREGGADPLAAVRAVLVGGASLAPAVWKELARRGIPVWEAYGSTEATCTITMNRPGCSRAGSVGRALEGLEVRVAGDGEVLCRGTGVMLGYYGDPDRTREVRTPEGWLHTGDLGRLDGDGYLHLVGRKKEVFLGADGNHFAPGRIEGMVEAVPGIAEAVLCGDGRAFVSALVVPDFEALREGREEPHASCPREPVCPRTDQALATCPRVETALLTEIERRVNPELSDFEAVRAIRVLRERFPSEVRGLTATAKVKVDRAQAQQTYADEIRRLYEKVASDLDRARAAFREPAGRLLEEVAAFHSGWIERDPAERRRIDRVSNADRFPDEPEESTTIVARFADAVAASSVRFGARSYAGHMVTQLPAIGIAAEAFMAVLNQNQVSADASPATSAVERQTIRWLADLVGYDPWKAAGVGAAGGSVANITALLAARNRALPRSGERGIGPDDRGVIVVSRRMHYSFRRAAELLGLGADQGLVQVAVDATNRISLDDLERRLDELSRAGRKVIAVVGIAGTSETGNVDPLAKLADVAEARGLWFHVDAALGAAALTSPRHRGRFEGIERAHSITVDPHKWFYVPYHCAYVLFRDEELRRHVELSDPHFVVLRPEEEDLGKWSIEGSRAANAIKFWMVAQALGRRGYAALVDRQIEMATELASLVDRSPDLERLSVPELNLLCFRYRPAWWRRLWDERTARPERWELNRWLDGVNVELQTRLARSGEGFLSRTTLEPPIAGLPVVALRAVLFHPEVGTADLERLLDLVLRLGAEVARERGADPERLP